MRHVRALLDHSLEIVIVLARVTCCLASFAVFPASVAYAWTGDIRWLSTLAICLVVGAAFGFVGFYVFGNEEWRRGEAEDRGA